MSRWSKLIGVTGSSAPVGWLGAAVLLGLWFALASPALGQQSGSTASREEPEEGYSGPGLFKTYCASCHGVSAKGDGPLADRLRFRPSDLTLLARRNKGNWDADKLRRTIDGRDPLKGHGGTDMPVWGDAFKNSREGYSEHAVRERIRVLVEYLHSLQASTDRRTVDAGSKHR